MEIAIVLLWIVAALLVIAGLAGLVLPGIPGAAVLYAGLVLAAWIEDFAFAGGGTLAILAVLALLTYVVDFVAGILGAKHFGASRRAMASAMLGAILGIFFGLPGLLLGPFVGAAIGEFSAQQSLGAAGRAGIGATIGLALGVAAKLSGFLHARRVRGGTFHDADHGILMRTAIDSIGRVKLTRQRQKPKLHYPTQS